MVRKQALNIWFFACESIQEYAVQKNSAFLMQEDG